jgi:hypothetical protein
MNEWTHNWPNLEEILKETLSHERIVYTEKYLAYIPVEFIHSFLSTGAAGDKSIETV